jgi:ABC-type multidrug transport system fused ATPase/permease subunit|tara:strand:+ start:8 stop:1747 length:1740 start_codon:yes stop_codon:yes gene_type:complete
MKIFINFWNILNKKEKIFFITIIFFSIIQALLELIGIAAVIPLVTYLLKPEAIENLGFLSKVINLEKITSRENIITIFCIILFLIFLIKNIIIVLTNTLTYKFIYSIRSKLYKNILNKILHQDYLFFVKKGMSKIFNVTFSEVNNYTANIVRPIINFITEFLISFTIVSLIVFSGYLEGLFVILPMIILAGLILKKMNKSIKHWSSTRILNNENIFNLNFSLVNGIKEILIFGKIKKILNNFSSSLNSLEKVDAKNAVIVTIPRVILEQFIILVLILIILSMYYAGKSSDSIIIILSFFLAAAYRLVPSFNRIFVAYQQIKFGKPSQPLISEYYNLENKNLFTDDQNIDENNFNLINFKKNIHLKDISFSYSDNKDILHKLNFTINKFDVIGIIGVSGSGKSTFVNILTRLIKPDSGNLSVDNTEIKSLQNIRNYQNLFNITSQDSFLLNGSIKDNIVFGGDSKISLKKLDEAIKFARLDKMIDELQDGIETDVGLTFKKLSSGQKQRIALARAYYLDRKIIIFDEATNALDEENESKVIENILKLKSKKTIIIISHNEKNLKKCDKIFKFENKTLKQL